MYDPSLETKSASPRGVQRGQICGAISPTLKAKPKNFIVSPDFEIPNLVLVGLYGHWSGQPIFFNKSLKLCVALRNLFVAPRLLFETLYTPNVSAVRQVGQSWLAELSGYTSRIIISRLRQTKLQAQPVNNATLTELYLTYYAVGRPFFHPRMAA